MRVDEPRRFRVGRVHRLELRVRPSCWSDRRRCGRRRDGPQAELSRLLLGVPRVTRATGSTRSSSRMPASSSSPRGVDPGPSIRALRRTTPHDPKHNIVRPEADDHASRRAGVFDPTTRSVRPETRCPTTRWTRSDSRTSQSSRPEGRKSTTRRGHHCGRTSQRSGVNRRRLAGRPMSHLERGDRSFRTSRLLRRTQHPRDTAPYPRRPQATVPGSMTQPSGPSGPTDRRSRPDGLLSPVDETDAADRMDVSF